MAQSLATQEWIPILSDSEIDDQSLPHQVSECLKQALENYKNKCYDECIEWCYNFFTQAQHVRVEIKFFINPLFLISNCYLEQCEYDKAFEWIERTFKPILTVCPEKARILHRFVIEIEERREHYVKAYVLSIVFKELTQKEEDDQTLNTIKRLLERKLSQEPESTKEIFDLLLEKGRSFLQANENSIALAVFTQIHELLDATRCKSQLKNEIKSKLEEYQKIALQTAVKKPAKPKRGKPDNVLRPSISPSPVAVSGRWDTLRKLNNSDNESTSSVTSEEDISRDVEHENEPDSVEPADESTFTLIKSKNRGKGKHKSVALPEGIEVICVHFENKANDLEKKKNYSRSLPIPLPPKVCQGCESKSFYAFWSKELCKWHRVRSCPANLRQHIPFVPCFKYQKGKPCDKECTHPHGPELQMWEIERDRQGLPLPQDWFKKSMSKCQPSNKKRLKKRPKKNADQDANASNFLPSAEVTLPAVPPQPINQEHPTSLEQEKYCYLPKDVKLVCKHFMQDFGSSSIGNKLKKNVCKKCRALGFVKDPIKYAFWSARFKQWFYIRERPTSVSPRVAFKECMNFRRGMKCTKNPCTFGHGPEVLVWTKDREGELIPPEEAYRSSIKDESTRTTRPLPPVVTGDELFQLCQSVMLRQPCRFGRCCRYAHSEEELKSWCDEGNERKRLQQRPSSLPIRQEPYEKTVSMPGVTFSCEPENPNVMINEDDDEHEHEWKFHIRYETNTEKKTPCIFLGERYSPHFSIKSVNTDAFDERKKLLQSHNAPMNNSSYCKLSESDVSPTKPHVIEIVVIVQFRASVFGSFPQRILFDFGTEPLLMKEFNIDVISGNMKETIPQLISVREELSQETLRVEESNIVRMEPREDESLLARYSLPKDRERIVSAQMLENKQIRPDTYIQTMHQVLFAEEAHMMNLLSTFTLSNAKLLVTRTCTDESSGLRIAPDGSYFGSIELQAIVTCDDKAGRVCTYSVQTVLLQSLEDSTLLYEAPIEILEEKKVTVKLFPKLCKDLKIERDDQEINVRMQFNLNRAIMCKMHKALDSLNQTHKRHLFPAKHPATTISRTTKEMFSPWLVDLYQSLNDDQMRVMQAITDTSSSQPLPLVVFGPFGTGKTFTLNKAIVLLTSKQSNRVLLCTHTNSAADIHVQLLDKYFTSKNTKQAARSLLRIFDPQRKLSTVSETSRKYALITDGAFVKPSRKNLTDHRIIVTTLTTADLLTKLNVDHGFFTHILIDEAAQAWETEAVIPVGLAGPNTKIVFTGDHMQMSPEVYTKFTSQWGLQKSLPERLFDHYCRMDDEDFRDQHVMYMTINYRSNKEILGFPSDICYGGEIVAMGDKDNPPHPVFGPLSFYSSKGKEKRHNNTYFNEAEVSEVVKRVKELANSWPNCWGQRDLKEIAVIAPYLSQVQAIRGELRKLKLKNVTVETIHNVQGKEFRALFISTVRTWSSIKDPSKKCSLEFLSDPKLLITAITRAKSLVAVVGDPVSLCSLGDCKSLWMEFINRCNLHGTTMEVLLQEIKETSIVNSQLNPKADCFVPGNSEKNDTTDYLRSDNIDDDELHQNVETDSNVDDFSNCSNDGESDSIEENQTIDEDLKFDVLPSDFDEIVKAFIKKRKATETTKAEEVEEVEEVEEEEWPSLPGPEKKPIMQRPTGRKRVDYRRLQSSDYEMGRDHGREEIRLLDLHTESSQRGRVSRPEHLSRETLSQMLKSDSSRYLIGQIHVGLDGWRKSSVEIPDKNSSDVKIRGDVRPAFDMDTVVLDKEKIQENPELESKTDCVLGILNHLIDPRERQYVCKIDSRHSHLMVPINKSVTKIANLTDKSCSKIPVYEKRMGDKHKRPSYEVQRMISRKEAKKKKYLFVVQFLQWRSDCFYPLGCVRRTLTQGETIEDCMRILEAEHGVRKASSTDIIKEVNKSFPKDWKIQESEIGRRKIVKNAFTIDPPECKDVDDAISVEKIDDTSFKVGIHIADVSYFVKPGSKVDEDARQRGTTYYPEISSMENIPMLPRELSENHCSLLKGKDRLTQSVYVILDSEGCFDHQKHTQTESTVTRSLCQLTYSDAQKVIEGEDLNPQIPKGDRILVKKSIQILHVLMQKVRLRRIRAVVHSEEERHDIAAHELVEEMMILANRVVGKILRASRGETTPFVCQHQPKVHRLNQWATKYGKYAKYLPSVGWYLQSEDIEEDIRQKVSTNDENIDILETFWNETCRPMAPEKLSMLEFLICDPNCSPQLHSASKHLRSIQIRAEYKSSSEEITHHSLALSDYVHFTSPIRRYMDIEIHRRLKGEPIDVDIDEVETFCRRSTFIKHNSRKFGKESKRISFSHSLKESVNNTGIEVYVDELENHCFVIQPRDPEQDLLSRNKKISIEDLSVHSKTDLNPNDKQEMTLTWKVRMYVSPSLEESKSDEPILIPKHREKIQIPEYLLKHHFVECKVFTIKGEKWLKLIKASAEKDLTRVKYLMEDISQKCNSNNHNESRIKVKSCDEDGHYYEVKLILRKFDIIHVQLFSSLSREILCPDIQLFLISSNFHICLQHQRSPRKCFVEDCYDNASRERYDNIEHYIKCWSPVLAMETATEAVSQNEGYTLKSHCIKWIKEDEKIEGSFTLEGTFCKHRKIKIDSEDFVCVRIPQYKGGANNEQSTKQVRTFWVGHGVVQVVKEEEKNNDKKLSVVLVIRNMVSDMPVELFDEDSHPACDLEIIHQPVPCRRMGIALNSRLQESKEVVQSICLGHMPSGGKFKTPDEDLSLSKLFKERTIFKELNKFQESAVKDALGNSFSMIQGPPGTGKTVTGIHIAYWFANQNRQKNTENDEKNDKKGGMLKLSAPPQVLYCGPSNKSVDVVTEYLLKIPRMKNKILRVYGTLIVEKEYPIPNTIKHFKPPRSDDELKLPEGEIREVALHHVIRNSSSPYSEELRRLENVFKEAWSQRIQPSDKDVKKYCETISSAEQWAIKSKEIILCTCSVSGSNLIQDYCNIMQCIVDECGMTMEPEVLVPMTSSKAKQIVLIGDHKQLQPIVVDREAEKLGLARSMFERLSTIAKERRRLQMLKLQYRMHPSICAFPSKCFYDNELQTDISVNRRVENAEFWPANRYYNYQGAKSAIVFCHVDGVEKSSMISTSDSGVDSKYNEQEANKAVQVAKTLVHKNNVKKTDVVILTPYREQRKIITDRLKGAYEDINVTTIIKSQGSEWDYVIISLVRSLPMAAIDDNPSWSWLAENIGFIAKEDQINVALTRAKKGLCVIGNRNLLRLNETWASLLEHYEEHKCVVDGKLWPE